MVLTKVFIEIVVLHDVMILDVQRHFFFFGLLECELLVFVDDVVRQQVVIKSFPGQMNTRDKTL